MALWKPFRGNRVDLDAVEKHDGYVYFCTDDGSLFFDYIDEDGNLQRKQINANEAEKLIGYDIATILNSSDVEIPTSKAIKTYVDESVALASIMNADIWMKFGNVIQNISQTYKDDGAIMTVQVVDALPDKIALSDMNTMTLNSYIVRGTGVAYLDVGFGAMSISSLLSAVGEVSVPDNGWLTTAPTQDTEDGIYCVPNSTPAVYFEDLFEAVRDETMEVGDSLSWDGSRNGRTVVTASADLGNNQILTVEYVHISDDIPTFENLSDGFSVSTSNGSYSYEPTADWTWLNVYDEDNRISISHKDGFVAMPMVVKHPYTESSALTGDIVWEKPGIYFAVMTMTKDGVTTGSDMVRYWTIPNYNFTKYTTATKIKENLLPAIESKYWKKVKVLVT